LVLVRVLPEVVLVVHHYHLDDQYHLDYALVNYDDLIEMTH
jgi:hypothetical protein